MPGTLLALYTCHAYNYQNDLMIVDWFTRPIVDRIAAIRDTWLKDVTIDYRLFFGRPPEEKERDPQDDEVFLDCPDGYYTASYKTKAMVRWALEHGYDRLVKVDDDVFVHWDRMVSCRSFTEGDYVGGGYTPDEAYAFGPCYWLSRRAMEALAAQPVGRVWAEDKWVGESLARMGIGLEFEPRFYIYRPPIDTRCQYVDPETLGEHNYVTIHSLTPDVMRRYYNEQRATFLGGE